jgi:hypothetical protein
VDIHYIQPSSVGIGAASEERDNIRDHTGLESHGLLLEVLQ